MAYDSQLACGLAISLSDGSNAMSSSDSKNVGHQAARQLSATGRAVRSFAGLSRNSADSSSQESEPVHVVGACVHTSAQYLEQHRATLQGQPLPIQAELTAELAAMGACYHMDTGRQLPYHSELPCLLPRHRRIGAQSSEAETQADAASEESARASELKFGKKSNPTLLQLQSLRQFAKPSDTGRRSILAGLGADSESTVKRKIVRRMMRSISMSEADVQAIVDGIHERRGRNIAETKRIVSALVAAVGTTGGQMDRRQEKQNKSLLRLRAGRQSYPQTDSTGEGGTSTRLSSTFISGDLLERQSKFLTKSKSSELDSENQQVVCRTELEGHGEVVRTPELESTIVSVNPPDFELVRNWKFEEAPVRRLRKPLLV